jgi:hypothetical protein
VPLAAILLCPSAPEADHQLGLDAPEDDLLELVVLLEETERVDKVARGRLEDVLCETLDRVLVLVVLVHLVVLLLLLVALLLPLLAVLLDLARFLAAVKVGEREVLDVREAAEEGLQVVRRDLLRGGPTTRTGLASRVLV